MIFVMIKGLNKLSNAELEALCKKKVDELVAIRRELDKRKNDSLPSRRVEFADYVTK